LGIDRLGRVISFRLWWRWGRWVVAASANRLTTAVPYADANPNPDAHSGPNTYAGPNAHANPGTNTDAHTNATPNLRFGSAAVEHDLPCA